MSKSKPPAECLAIIICEGVVEDARSHNKCILNVFNSIWTPAVPVTQDRLTVFLSLTGIHGELPVKLTFGQEGVKPVVELKGTVKAASPLDVADLVLNVRNVPLAAYGQYVVNAEVSGVVVGTRRIRVLEPRKPGGGAG